MSTPPLTTAQIMQTCSGDISNQTAYLECVTTQLLNQDAMDRQRSRSIDLIYSAALVFFMQAGKSVVVVVVDRRGAEPMEWRKSTVCSHTRGLLSF